jgi:hypothetical protein
VKAGHVWVVTDYFEVIKKVYFTSHGVGAVVLPRDRVFTGWEARKSTTTVYLNTGASASNICAFITVCRFVKDYTMF